MIEENAEKLNKESEEMNREREKMKCDLHADTNHTHTYGKYMLEYLSQCTICVCNGEIEHAPLVYVISMKTIKPLNHGQEDKHSQ